MADFFSIFLWWLTIFLVGIIFLPVTSQLFSKFIDRGYIFTKIIGILLSSYFVWFAGSFGLLPFTRLTITIVLIGAALINLWLLKENKEKGTPNKRLFFFLIFEECLFLATLSFWSYVRACEPSIRGLEKFMDFGFVNSILKANFFPPLDMWLTRSPEYSPGYFINYYYFGHYITAFLTKLSGIDSAITYNLMIATLFAFTFTLPFSIGMNLYYLFIKSKVKSPWPGRQGRQNFEEREAKPKVPILETALPKKTCDQPQIRYYAQDNWKKERLGVSEKFGTEDLPVSVMIKALLVGLLTAFLVALGGNLHTLYAFTSGYPNENPEPPWKLSAGFYPERYWYPNATRFIPFTIHEFPIYSFVVADLHGHFLDIPLVLLTVAILLSLMIPQNSPQLLINNQNKRLANNQPSYSPLNINSFFAEFKQHTSVPFLKIILLGLLLACMYMTNAWDGLIYMILTGLVFFCLNLANSGSDLKRLKGLTLSATFSALYKTFSACLFLLFFFLVASLPFSLNFKPFVSGIGVLCAPTFLSGKSLGPFLFEAGKCQKSPVYQLVILWGFFYYNVIGFLLFIVIPFIRKKWGLLLTSIDVFILLLIFISTLLLVFPEFFYMKDIYPAHYRANTMFKLGYQAFMMLGIASAYIFFRIKHQFIQLGESKPLTYYLKRVLLAIVPLYVYLQLGLIFFNKKETLTLLIIGLAVFYLLSRIRRFMVNKNKYIFLTLYNDIFMVLLFLVAIYPYFAINSYYGGLQVYRGLYGLNWLANQYPDDYQAILWLRKNIQCNQLAGGCNNQPVIVEANGESYTDYARVSANTGLPTIVGWPVHEWLWRGSYDEAGKRIPEVAAVYESKDINQTREILRKYNAEYIFMGTLEREKYKNINEEKLQNLGKVVFESGNTKIYRITPF